jgi:hypothetical protein
MGVHFILDCQSKNTLFNQNTEEEKTLMFSQELAVLKLLKS